MEHGYLASEWKSDSWYHTLTLSVFAVQADHSIVYMLWQPEQAKRFNFAEIEPG
ncbi:hypothetical protein MHH93_07795 [Priestia sp. FSL H7-0729]